MRVTTGFESGRIDVLGVDEKRAHVAVAHDVAAPGFRQWFAFDVESEPGKQIEIVVDNAGECTWGDALGGDYRAYVSEGDAWKRTDSRLDRGKLWVRHTLQASRLRVAFYPPFPSSRLPPLRRAIRRAGGQVDVLGCTAQGRPIERFELGSGPRHVWVLAQQHPGESMAGWFIEGLVAGLCQPTDAARALFERAKISVVPRMNPDGAAVGNHRTTPLGVDLNRTWALDDAPVEIAVVREAMKRSGVSFALDVHGDERLPWVFSQSADWYRGRPAHIDASLAGFDKAMLAATPDYQTEHKYPYHATSKPNPAFCSNWVQTNFDCAALTLEMPFSDHRGRPDPRGFFPARARRLGKKAIVGILAAIAALPV